MSHEEDEAVLMEQARAQSSSEVEASVDHDLAVPETDKDEYSSDFEPSVDAGCSQTQSPSPSFTEPACALSASPSADEDDGPVLNLGSQTRVPKTSLFEATVDAPIAIPIQEGRLHNPIFEPKIEDGSCHESSTDLDDSGTEREESLFGDEDSLSSGASRNRCRLHRSTIFCLAIVLFVLSAGLAVGILFEHTDVFDSVKNPLKDERSPATNPPSMPPSEGETLSPTVSPTSTTTTNDPLFTILQGFSDGTLDDRNSPQFRAYQWMLNEDPLIDANSDPIRIQERYALTTIYMALVGEMPIFATRDECTWPTVKCDTITNVSGLFSAEDMLTAAASKEEWRATHISMTKMSLNGTIPPEIGLLEALVTLDMAENPSLTGSIPEELYALTNLKKLYLHENTMTGTISESIANLQKLEEVFLGSNAFTGTIPFNLGSRQGIRPLRYLILHDNQFEGPIPLGLNLKNMFHFDLSYNNLTGSLPSDIGDTYKSLRHLYLDHNKFTGTVPESYATVGNGRLYVLTLDNNQLTGGLPTSWVKDNVFVDTITAHRNNMTVRIDKDVCKMSVFEGGELVELGADCEICSCTELCTNCYE